MPENAILWASVDFPRKQKPYKVPKYSLLHYGLYMSKFTLNQISISEYSALMNIVYEKPDTQNTELYR